MIDTKTASEPEIVTGIESPSQIAPRDWRDTAQRSLPVPGTGTNSGGDGTLGRSSTVVTAELMEVMLRD